MTIFDIYIEELNLKEFSIQVNSQVLPEEKEAWQTVSRKWSEFMQMRIIPNLAGIEVLWLIDNKEEPLVSVTTEGNEMKAFIRLPEMLSQRFKVSFEEIIRESLEFLESQAEKSSQNELKNEEL